MKLFLTLIIIAAWVVASSQPIYKGLTYGMSKGEAKKEYKTNKALYDNVDLGNGFVWRLYTQNFIFDGSKLSGVLFSPKGAAMGLSHKNTILYLEFTRAFFENKGYTLFFEPDYWQYPQNFISKYGLILVHPNKTNVVQMYPVNIGSGTYTAALQVLNFDWFITYWDKGHKEIEEKQQNAGF